MNAAGKIEAKATVQADGRKVIVNGEAQADKTGIAVDAEAVVTLTAKAGYTITSGELRSGFQDRHQDLDRHHSRWNWRCDHQCGCRSR